MMRRFSGELPERDQEFLEISSALQCPDIENRKLAPLYKSFHDEAMSLAKLPRDAAIVDGRLTQLEFATLPKEDAVRRSKERYAKQRAEKKAP
jgi:hypothetical protein